MLTYRQDKERNANRRQQDVRSSKDSKRYSNHPYEGLPRLLPCKHPRRQGIPRIPHLQNHQGRDRVHRESLLINTSRARRLNRARMESKTMTAAEKMIGIISSAYIQAMGFEKWNSLTNEQKHDAVMIIAKDALNNLK